MRNQPPDKYNVAWFKLAECVSRGEKERALGVYRLLAHSLHDHAFARQLQGDILCAFNDTKTALEHYRSAAQLYQQDNRLLEAAAIYEHILILVSDKHTYLTTLIELYIAQGIATKASMHLIHLFSLLLGQGQLEETAHYIDLYHAVVSASDLITIRQQLIVAWLEQEKDVTALMPHVFHHIDALMHGDKIVELPRFLTSLQALNIDCYTQAHDYIERCDNKKQ